MPKPWPEEWHGFQAVIQAFEEDLDEIDLSVDEWLALAASPNAEERREACTALVPDNVGARNLETHPTVAARLHELMDDPHPSVRFMAVLVSGDVAHAPIVSRLIELVDEAEANDKLLRMAVRSLGLQKAPRALPVLNRYLARADEDGRRTALIALGDLGDERAIPTLLHYADAPEVYVRWCAAMALRDLGRTDKALDIFEGLLDDRDLYEDSHAVKLLREAGRVP